MNGYLFLSIGYDVGISRMIIGENPSDRSSTDLTNDHPIGVLYRGQGDSGASASLRARSTLISGIDLYTEKTDGSNVPPLVTGNLWAGKGFVSDSATIQDLLGSGQGAGTGNYVQCASCHDPHYKNQTNPEKDFYTTYYDRGQHGARVASHNAYEIDGLFLRRVGGNSDSGVCRTCHSK